MEKQRTDLGLLEKAELQKKRNTVYFLLIRDIYREFLSDLEMSSVILSSQLMAAHVSYQHVKPSPSLNIIGKEWFDINSNGPTIEFNAQNNEERIP